MVSARRSEHKTEVRDACHCALDDVVDLAFQAMEEEGIDNLDTTPLSDIFFRMQGMIPVLDVEGQVRRNLYIHNIRISM